MGWYTSNASDSFQWKYGDVVELAGASRLGELRLMPRVDALDSDHECFDGEVFLGPLQHWVISQKLPWKRPIPFDPEDESHESVIVPLDVNVEEMLAKWARVLRANKKSLLAALKHFNEFEDDEEVAKVAISTDALWSLPESGYGALVEWLNAPLSGKGKARASFTIAALRAGTFEQFDEYSPSEPIKAALEALPGGDGARVMAAHALGHALLEGSPLQLFMPDDVWYRDVWGSDDE